MSKHLLMCLSIAAALSSIAEGGPTCNFNPKQASAEGLWSAASTQHSETTEAQKTALVFLMNTGKWPTITPSNGMMQPQLVLVRGLQNATIGFPIDPTQMKHPQARLAADIAWLEAIERETGSRWILETVMAHELGHLLYRHSFGEGPSDPQERELQADHFAGYALCRVSKQKHIEGISLADIQAVFRSISPDTVTPSDDHPAKGARLAAVRDGWKEGGCS